MKRHILSVFLILFGSSISFAQNSPQNKTGGICWRIDDHQGASKWRDWNALFNKYGLKYSLAINASRLFNDTAAVNALKEAVASGHELMDHTPDHHMGYFTVKTLSDTTAFSGHLALDHINGTKICLKVDVPYTNNYIGEGSVNLIGNKLISLANGEFKNINGNPYYPLVYLPIKNQYAVYSSVQNKNISDPDTLVLQTYWGEIWKNDTLYSIAYHRITTADIRTNPASNLLLAQRSIQLFNSFGLPTPKTWIQPGGSFGLLNRAEVKAFSDITGYKSGAVNILSSQKCYNEVDSFNNRRYSLQGPDFYEESNNYQGLTNIISDRSARHYNSFGLSHMTNVAGGWSVFLARVDSVLNWSKNNQIPTRTYEQWASILFDSIPNQAANILPSLQRDLNANGFPDAYNNNTTFDPNDGVAVSGNKSFGSASNNAVLASINNLGGLEKGNNIVRLYTKGQLGDSVRMIITYPELSLPSQYLMFPANTASFTLQSRTATIPSNITRINVSWVVIKKNLPGIVKISGLEMRKSSIPSLNKGYKQVKMSGEAYATLNLNSYTQDGYFPPAQLTYAITSNSRYNINFDTINRILSVQNVPAFFVGTDSIKVKVSNPDGFTDSAYFRFQSNAYSIASGDTLITSINPILASGNPFWISHPLDTTLQFNTPLLSVQPKTNTWYLLKQNNVLIDSFLVEVTGAAPIDTSHTDSSVTDPGTPGNTYSNSAFANKIGGVCFRIDDQQSAANYRAILAVFNKYNKNLTLGINASKLPGDTAAINALKQLAAAGHELADHTPDHSMSFFNVALVQDTNAYRGNPGVDHFNGKKVCLKIDSVITGNYLLEGLVQTNGALLISQNNGEWKDLGAPVYYSNIYLPHTNKTYNYSNLLNKNQNDPDTMTLQSYWGETVNLPAASNVSYHRLTQYDIKPGQNSLNLVANRSLYIFDSLGLPRPKTFLMPYGNYGMLTKSEVKNFYGGMHGYTAGGVFLGSSLKCYNESDTADEKRFGMHGPDFKEESSSANSIIGIIADNSAKHYCSFGLSMMTGMSGGLSGYIARIDSILAWCELNQIPVLTFNQWANVLYDSIPNPFINSFPALQQDLNNNGVPDGYSSPFSTFDTSDGVSLSHNRSYARNNSGTMTAVQYLAGIEKGSNLFYISTKGFAGDSVRITLSYPELGGTNSQWMVPASTANWTEYSYPIQIPVSVSKASFTFSAAKRSVPGNLKISGMQLFAAGFSKTMNEAIGTPQKEKEELTMETKELLLYPNPFENKVYLDGLTEEEFRSIEAYDLLGNRQNINSQWENQSITFNNSDGAKGMYLLKFTAASGPKFYKILRN